MGKSLCRTIKQGDLPAQIKDVVGLTSRLNQIAQNQTLNLQDFSNFEIDQPVDGFVHLAFLTRDYVSKMSLADYQEINSGIIDRASEIIRKTKPRWIALVSSGAVFTKESDYTQLETSLNGNPYGYLKLREEEAITQAAIDAGSNLAIGRLWGATGQDLPNDPKYAISDFINSAIHKRNIIINSEHEVYRRYGDASEFMQVLIRSAHRGGHTLFNSGGPLVELGGLASEVASRYEACQITRKLAPGNVADRYYPKDQSFEILAQSLGVEISDLKEQVSRTILGHSLVD